MKEQQSRNTEHQCIRKLKMRRTCGEMQDKESANMSQNREEGMNGLAIQADRV